MPSLPAAGRVHDQRPWRLLRRPQVLIAMAATMMLFMGIFGIYTYIRPFLEEAAGFSTPAFSLMLLVSGLAGVVGTTWVGRQLRRRLFSLLIGLPLVLAAIVVAMIFLSDNTVALSVLMVGWGFVSAAAPAGWGVWLSKALADEAEAGGGLQVAAIQLAIMAGASLGGVAVDNFGWQMNLGLGAMLLLGSSCAAAVTRAYYHSDGTGLNKATVRA